MNVRITELARWQVKLAIQDLLKRRDPEAEQFDQSLRKLFADPSAIPAQLRPLEGMPELPHQEIVVGSYRLLFRREDETLWMLGLWPPLYAE